MNPSHPRSQARRRPLFRIEPEVLESRQLLTGGAGNTFALNRGTIADAGGVATSTFQIESGHFTMPKGRMTLGVDVVPSTGSTLKPVITAIVPQGEGARGPAFHQRVNSASGPHAVLTTVNLPKKGQGTAANYQVKITAQSKTSGDFLLGYYLPGDADGNGKVEASDLAAIRGLVGKTVNDAEYNFEADSNRDGRITRADVKLATPNLGVGTTITPDFTANLDPTTDTGAPDRITNSSVVQFNGQAAPGSAISFHEVDGKAADAKTTADSTGKYNISLSLAAGTNNFEVTSVDTFGQTIRGRIQPVTFTTAAVPPKVS